MFVTFEGPEGGGKSTQIERLAASLRAAGRTIRVVREPGSTWLGEQVRGVLLTVPDVGAARMSDRAEALLFAAARAQLVNEVIRPALDRGEIVLADRFSDSTRAYQVAGRGLPAAAIDQIITFATNGLEPNLTFLLDIDAAVGLARKDKRGDRLEREDLEFHQRVRLGYRALAERHPERVVVLDATRDPDHLAALIVRYAREFLDDRESSAKPGALVSLECDPQEGDSAR